MKKKRNVTEKQIAVGTANLRKGHANSDLQRSRRLAQIAHEESEAEKLRSEGFEVFSPTVVCDRIAIKDGRVFFVEFKKEGQALREGQQRVFELMPENYLIRYS